MLMFKIISGGEHVAASSAGRTLLSCWWIFCIVIVTTYSGNFVAFLTVTKEILPFNDVEGLVAQNTYKWGTAGATVFETILKVTFILVKLIIEMENVSKRQQPDHRTDNTRMSPIGLQCSEQLPHPEASFSLRLFI